MTILFYKSLLAIRRKWKLRRDADKPSWAARVIIQSLDGELSAGSAEGEWQCRRAPVFVRMFRRTGRGRF